MRTIDAFGFERTCDGCEFETPTVKTIAYWRSNQRRVQEAGFAITGQRIAEHVRDLTQRQREMGKNP